MGMERDKHPSTMTCRALFEEALSIREKKRVFPIEGRLRARRTSRIHHRPACIPYNFITLVCVLKLPDHSVGRILVHLTCRQRPTATAQTAIARKENGESGEEGRLGKRQNSVQLSGSFRPR